MYNKILSTVVSSIGKSGVGLECVLGMSLFVLHVTECCVGGWIFINVASSKIT